MDKIDTLMKIVEKYKRSSTAEEEVRQEQLTFDELCTKLTAFLVIWENEAL